MHLDTIRNIVINDQYEGFLKDKRQGFPQEQTQNNHSNLIKLTKQLVRTISLKAKIISGLDEKTAKEFEAIMLGVLGAEDIPYDRPKIASFVSENQLLSEESVSSFISRADKDKLGTYLKAFVEELIYDIECAMALPFQHMQYAHIMMHSTTAIGIALQDFLLTGGFQEIQKELRGMIRENTY